MAKKVVDRVNDILKDFLSDEGYELYHCEYQKEGKDWYLRVYIDSLDENEYIGTDDCEKVSRFLGDELDKEDIIDKNYYLEVSSPGMDRELITDEHFERYKGELVDVKLYKAFEGEKELEGELVDKNDGELIIRYTSPVNKKSKNKKEEAETKLINLPVESISKVRLAVII